jgi:hypothetical protein
VMMAMVMMAMVMMAMVIIVPEALTRHVGWLRQR